MYSTDTYTAPADPLAGTGLDQFPQYGTHTPPAAFHTDLGAASPNAQFQALTDLLEASDIAHPAPFTGTPPWGEPTPDWDILPPAVELAEYMPAADLEQTDDPLGDPLSRVRDPFPLEYPGTDWYNDDQMMGLAVPPGAPNLAQPVESGHTQNVRHDPSAEAGWDAWSGRYPIARVPRYLSTNPFYSRDVNRRHGVAVEKMEMPYALLTQQYRDLLLSELKRRGVHNVVIAEVPSVPFTEQVTMVDPADYYFTEAPIGREGVLPYSGAHGDHLAAMGGV